MRRFRADAFRSPDQVPPALSSCLRLDGFGAESTAAHARRRPSQLAAAGDIAHPARGPAGSAHRPADRRGDQPRQLRRVAAEHPRRGHRHETRPSATGRPNSGVGFAVPINTVLDLLDELRGGKVEPAASSGVQVELAVANDLYRHTPVPGRVPTTRRCRSIESATGSPALGEAVHRLDRRSRPPRILTAVARRRHYRDRWGAKPPRPPRM